MFFIKVKVSCTDFVSFTFMCHFFRHIWSSFKLVCSLCVAIAGFSYVIRTAVSSAKVAGNAVSRSR
jgi:hypothetical protein